MNVSADNLNGNSAHLMSLPALLAAQTVSFLHWNSATIDKVLVQGGSLYLSAFENVNIQPEGFLLVNELPTVVLSVDLKTSQTTGALLLRLSRD